MTLPPIAFGMLLIFPNPVTLVLIAGASLTLLLPVMAFATLYFRYRSTDPSLHGNKLWGACLWISSLKLLIVGTWLVYTLLVTKVARLFP